MELKRYSNSELEQISEDFLSKWGAGKYDGRALRIESLIESYGYCIFPVPGLSEIAEAYVPLKQGFIFVDEEQYLNGASFRWRFTIAEELAHVLLHRPMFEGKSVEEIEQIQSDFSDRDYLTIEQNAKYLAGCLLMPRSEFVERFQHFSSIQSQRSSNALVILRHCIRQLSLDFNVSCYSVALRSLHLDLIDQQQLDDLIECNGW